MGKLRNHGGDTIIGMAQWLGRKIRHHDPLSEVDSWKPMRAGQNKLRVSVVKDDPSTIVYLLANGARYEIKVREMAADEPEQELVAVGQ